jgi:lipopolysaccharide biosynthesis glycosyltransferase
MPDNRDPMRYDIAFGLDAEYVPHLAATIASILRHIPESQLRFLILHAGVPVERRLTLQRVAPQALFVWIEVSSTDVPTYPERLHVKHVNRATLFRLGLEKLAPADTKRVLYLDSDVIVLRDPRELWSLDLGGSPIAAVADPDVDPNMFKQRWRLPECKREYFNAGVLFVDLERVRAERLFAVAIDFVAREQPWLSDQDGLNYALWGRWHPLQVTWNVLRRVALDAAGDARSHLREAVRNPAIVHYSGSQKPWLPDGYHPWAWLYWQSLSRTPFRDEVVREYGISRLQRLRLWLRWLRRRPAGEIAQRERRHRKLLSACNSTCSNDRNTA